MTIAWIAWRSHLEVVEVWDSYRLQCSDWHFREWRIGPTGELHEGYFLEHRLAATLPRLALSEAYRRARGTIPKDSIGIDDAITKLRNALGDNATQATGIRTDTRERAVIPDYEWRDLEFFEERGRDVVRFRDGRLVSARGYDEVTFRRKHIMAIWQVTLLDQRGATLPEIMRPTGPGHMPLYCAVQWIATKGGTISFEPSYAPVWDRAYAELLARISSDEVTITGLRHGIREKLQGHLFASIVVDHTFGNTSIDLILGDELHLQSYVYIDDEHWRNGFDDSLRDRAGIQWSQIMVRKSDIARWWPFDTSGTTPETHSGAPGRPSVMHLIEAEYDRRKGRGEIAGGIGKVAAELAAWAKVTYPDYRTPGAGAIENALRSKHRQSTK
jgi:hypothetical protein